MSARRILALGLVSVALFVGCTGDEQALGGGRAPSPQPTTMPTTWPNAIENNCPRLRPIEGGKCDTFDEHGTPVTTQCKYDDGQSVCICATGNKWACFRAASGLLSLDVCREGESCVEGVGCGTPAQICTCDGAKLRCLDRAIAP